MNRGAPPDISNTHSLLVLNIPFSARPDSLRADFSRFGEVADIYIPRSRVSGESRGFAYVPARPVRRPPAEPLPAHH